MCRYFHSKLPWGHSKSTLVDAVLRSSFQCLPQVRLQSNLKFNSTFLPSSILFNISFGSCILGMWMQPEHWPVPGKVSLPIQPFEVTVTNLRSTCSLSGSPTNSKASCTFNANTSPHLPLLFNDDFGRKKFLA